MGDKMKHDEERVFFFPIKLLPQLFSPMLDQAVNLET